MLRNHTERITIWNLISLRLAQKPIKAPLYSAPFYMNILWKCSTVWSQQRRVVCIWYTNICISKPKMNIRWKRYDMWRRWSKPREGKEKNVKISTPWLKAPPISVCVWNQFFSHRKHENSLLAFVSRYDCFLRCAATLCDVLDRIRHARRRWWEKNHLASPFCGSERRKFL